MNKQTISTEKLKEKLKLPEYPEGYEKDFFDAIEEDLNIDAATAKRVRITKEKREDVILQIVEGKQFEEIKETYPKLPRFTYNECVKYIKYWFSFSEQELFKKKINGEELNKKLNPLDMGKCALDLDALAVLIRLDSSVFVEHYKNYNHKWYFDIARV